MNQTDSEQVKEHPKGVFDKTDTAHRRVHPDHWNLCDLVASLLRQIQDLHIEAETV